jgi:hypothetical protein
MERRLNSVYYLLLSLLVISVSFNLFLLLNWTFSSREILEEHKFYPWIISHYNDGYFAPSANLTKFNPISTLALGIWFTSFCLLFKNYRDKRNLLFFVIIITLFLQILYLFILLQLDKPICHD